MCPGDTDAPAVAKLAYSHKQKQKKNINKGQSLWKPQYVTGHFET